MLAYMKAKINVGEKRNKKITLTPVSVVNKCETALTADVWKEDQITRNVRKECLFFFFFFNQTTQIDVHIV